MDTKDYFDSKRLSEESPLKSPASSTAQLLEWNFRYSVASCVCQMKGIEDVVNPEGRPLASTAILETVVAFSTITEYRLASASQTPNAREVIGQFIGQTLADAFPTALRDWAAFYDERRAAIFGHLRTHSDLGSLSLFSTGTSPFLLRLEHIARHGHARLPHGQAMLDLISGCVRRSLVYPRVYIISMMPYELTIQRLSDTSSDITLLTGAHVRRVILDAMRDSQHMLSEYDAR